MIAQETGSVNSTVGNSSRNSSTPLIKDNVSSRNNVYGRLKGLFQSAPSPPVIEESGYVEFEHLDNSSVTAMNCLGRDQSNTHKRTLGTFSGVFSPVVLSMFSALIFIRVGFIVGNAGLYITLLQFVIAYAILIFTVMSVCAVSTNGAIEGGGAYFMISRTLGPEFGGSIGTLFFFANVVSSALYILGCTEGLLENLGPSGYLIPDGSPPLLKDSSLYRLLYCTLLNTLSVALCLVGAKMFARTSAFILAVVVICVISVVASFFFVGPIDIPVPDRNTIIQNMTYRVNVSYTGLNRTTLLANLNASYGKDYTSPVDQQVTFAIVFGVLFSGVTGIMAGANMSGELKNPSKSIPRGTLSAIGFTFFCYILLSILTAATCSRELLQNNYMYMMPINLWPPFVTIGVLTATFFAALSNLIGGSRVLEALAKDRVFGFLLNFITKGTWRGNPLAAVGVSWLLVQVMLCVGSLNVVAQINSVLFLLSYLATNLACMGLQLASAPNFRPSFKFFSVHTAAAGLIGSFAMMCVINVAYASFSIVVCVALVVALHLFSTGSGQANWGSISQALIFHQVRKYLLLLDSRKNHVKYWRPQILLLVSNPRSCCPLIDFINDIKKSGLYVLGHVIVSDADCRNDPTIEQSPHWLELIDTMKVKAFVELTTARSVREGFQHLVRISGMGAMKPNTVVLGFYDNHEPIDFFNSETLYKTTIFDINSEGLNDRKFPIKTRKTIDISEYVAMIADSLYMGKNVCVCRHFGALNKVSINNNPNAKYIDVWAFNILEPENSTNIKSFDTNSLFMMQLAVICTMVGVWKKLKIRVFVASDNIQSDNLALVESLKMLRIRADIYEIPNWSQAKGLLETNNQNNFLYDSDDNHSEKNSISDQYIKTMNQTLIRQSDNTVVTFIYLPKPPGFTSEESELISNHFGVLTPEKYLKILTSVSDNLPPTVFVHGLNAVTSTTL